MSVAISDTTTESDKEALDAEFEVSNDSDGEFDLDGEREACVLSYPDSTVCIV